jgi:CRISPR-associated protein Cmr1
MDKQKTLTVTLETVTPFFLGGADSRGQPELRPPVFRGALRYWLRAALGGALGDSESSLIRLRACESAVFGSTDEKVGASVISLRVADPNLLTLQTYKRQPAPHVKTGTFSRRQPTGRDYLYWSMGESGNQARGNYQLPKQFYPPGSSFNLVFNLRPSVGDVGQQFRQAVGSLWLLVQCGGIGSRSRRTAGSLSVRGKCEVEGLVFTLSADSIAQAASQLGAGLAAVRQQFSSLGNVVPHFPSAFDLLHPTVCRMWVLGIWQSSDAAVEAIGVAMRDFRAYRNPDHVNVAKWLQGQPIPTVERAAFGLPQPYRYSQGGPAGVVQGRLQPPGIDRRSSPLWLKVSKTSGGNYIGVATLFKSLFLPVGEKLYAKTKGSPPAISVPQDYGLIEQFILKSFPDCQEVSYD